ncbi:MAG: (2Fe-2S)-binding protein [Rhizobiales bacterium]|nr:(2Fe-2S)-binding protein [Hyphomicrobiales bacterium]
MIICNCNAISDRDFKKVAENSNASIKNCFSALGKKPNCGRCFTSINDIIQNVHSEYEQADKIKKSAA